MKVWVIEIAVLGPTEIYEIEFHKDVRTKSVNNSY